ncbi:MAG: cation diffusion facilitator family transporter [Chloroflexi bacterium]|nr:cation diffusion facilitator family transporter [Chloroflexota bacterium]
MDRSKSRAAMISVGSNTMLVLLKAAVGISMGSVSVVSEAIHSAIDLLAAMIAFFSLRAAEKPADREHPYGHGKLENVSGTVEASLIFLAALLIVYEAGEKLLGQSGLSQVDLGIVTMFISVVVNILVSRFLYHMAHKTDSLALEADAKHLSTDVWTSAGVFAGLIAVRITGLHWLDPVIALAVAVAIIRAAYEMTKKSLEGLLDIRLPEEEEERIRAIIVEHYGDLVGFHDLRSRKAGSERHIDLHLVVPRATSVEQAHGLCDHLEGEIMSQLPNCSITIHIEPCDSTCTECAIECEGAVEQPQSGS